MADPDGLLAYGGDLSQARLLAAYRSGIFPWYTDRQPILWWSPDPRCVLFPEKFRASQSLQKRLRRGLKNGELRFSLDAAFARVMENCAAPRTKHTDEMPHTWITSDMADAYTELHRRGIAHSAELWRVSGSETETETGAGELIGGLYGVALGGVFFGESMFHRETDASKMALALLVAQLRDWGFRLIDCQVESPHLLSLGAEQIPRTQFQKCLKSALKLRGMPGSWRGYGVNLEVMG